VQFNFLKTFKISENNICSIKAIAKLNKINLPNLKELDLSSNIFLDCTPLNKASFAQMNKLNLKNNFMSNFYSIEKT
jgi:hypothetical protein